MTETPKIYWLAQYDGKLEEGKIYACADCGFQWLTIKTAVWKWGIVREAQYENGGCSIQTGYTLVCRDPRDCWRRAEFMGTAGWKEKKPS